jgi:formate/nitrite transporter
MEKGLYSPAEIAKELMETGCRKSSLPTYALLILGMMAGAFIAFAAAGSNVAIHTVESVGIAKALAGTLFTAGLMMVIIAGGELFTGNSLIIISCLEGRNKWPKLLRNWLWVYLGNFIGALIIAFFVVKSGQLNFSDGALAGFTIKTAVYKTGLTFENAFFMGVLCNWLVCLAVWMAAAAKDVAGKVLAIFFPIWLFVASGYEHSIANMYYIPVGILAKANGDWVNAALSMGVSPEALEGLNWFSLVTRNLIPVTLGNILGGALFVGGAYWLSYLYKGKKKELPRKAGKPSL